MTWDIPVSFATVNTKTSRMTTETPQTDNPNFSLFPKQIDQPRHSLTYTASFRDNVRAACSSAWRRPRFAGASRLTPGGMELWRGGDGVRQNVGNVVSRDAVAERVFVRGEALRSEYLASWLTGEG